MSHTPSRYAVYWTPEPDHPLWNAGWQWLRRDATCVDALPPPRPDTETPRRYGFHATLKPPLTLHPRASLSSFLDAVAALAAHTPRFAMPALTVAWLADFLALRPAPAMDASHPLHQLADRCVRELDPWREMPNGDELQRRLAQHPLDAQQRDHLLRWGYPHVFDRWRFHMTLSDSLPRDATVLRERVAGDSHTHFAAALAAPLHCESLCVFTEPAEGAPFVLTHRFALAA